MYRALREEARSASGWLLEEGHPASAAVLRVAFGLVSLFMLWDFYPVLDLLFGHAGYFGTLDPAFVPALSPSRLLFHFDGPRPLHAFFWTFVGAAVCLTAGLFTRVACVAVVVFLHLFQQRNPFAIFGADSVLMHIAFWLLFLKSGSIWSVDAWLRRRRGAPEIRVIPLWPVKGIQIQMAFIYLMSGLAKVDTEPWKDGSAVYFALDVLGNGLFSGLMHHKILLTLLTYGALAVEVSFAPLVFWKPTRWLALVSAVLLHVGIELFMVIRFFGLVMDVGLLSFVTPEEWLRLRDWIARRAR